MNLLFTCDHLFNMKFGLHFGLIVCLSRSPGRVGACVKANVCWSRSNSSMIASVPMCYVLQSNLST